MDPTQYLSAGLLLLLIIGCWNLLHAIQRAIEGYQDQFGFHFGPTPLAFAFFSNEESSLFGSFSSARPVLAKAPRSRRSMGSKPPMLPEGMNIDDLNPQPVSKTKRNSRSLSKKQSQSGQTQIPFPGLDHFSESE